MTRRADRLAAQRAHRIAMQTAIARGWSLDRARRELALLSVRASASVSRPMPRLPAPTAAPATDPTQYWWGRY